MRKYLFALFLVPLLAAGCAHGPAVKAPGPSDASAERAALREELLLEAGRKPEAGKEKKDDFIEVDDRRGLLKTWPMALFVALIAAACGVF